jgi:hypothetical protein
MWRSGNVQRPSCTCHQARCAPCSACRPSPQLYLAVTWGSRVLAREIAICGADVSGDRRGVMAPPCVVPKRRHRLIPRTNRCSARNLTHRIPLSPDRAFTLRSVLSRGESGILRRYVPAAICRSITRQKAQTVTEGCPHESIYIN